MYRLGTYDGEGILDGLEIEVSRVDGKGFTVLRAIGPHAAEIRDCVKSVAEGARDRDRRRVQHVMADDYADARVVRVYGRLRQTRAAVELGLFAYSAHLACQHPGTPAPQIRLKPHEAS